MTSRERIESFIKRWQGQEGGQERANYALFLAELCDALDVPRPDPANASTEGNDYVFERVVKEIARDGAVSSKRIDLYRRNSFILEAKQSRWKGGRKEVAGQSSLFEAGESTNGARGRRSVDRAWDVLMLNARRQAEDYVRLLPAAQEPPPFVIVCDVGHCLEVYANFRRDGKAYDQFPDRRGFRIYLEDLRDPKLRDRLVAIWNDPMSLDPSRHAARVTREIAERLAAVTKALEDAQYPPEDVAMFLMRLLFTMFAEDVGLLPKDCLKEILVECEQKPEIFTGMMEELWRAMDKGSPFSAAIRAKVPRFNGEFFLKNNALPLGREEIGELRRAAECDWRDVEPAIFGTLLEQALDEDERRRLGAHYTPRAYVERLVIATVIDPLREEWAKVLSTAERQKAEKRTKNAIATVRKFHDRLCDTRILDPACGTGNFLYVSLELMKRLEGEVLEALIDLGGEEALTGLERHTVDPHAFHGLELNPRAAAIAELVLWIGYLQWHFRTKGGAPSEPILKAFKNIQVTDAVLAWDGWPLPKVVDGRETYPNARQPEWPAAEYIVGNPPFVAGQNLRDEFGDGYAETLWKAHPHIPGGADFVMFWWDRAAELLGHKGSRLRRFGLVTTNSITQQFASRVVARRLRGKPPVSLVMAIPNHPWTKATKGAAAVRIAMTVGELGEREGVLLETSAELGLDSDNPDISFVETHGRINPGLSVGVDVTQASKLKANERICHDGVKLHGKGFIITPAESEHLGIGRRPGAERVIRPYLSGRDVNQRPRRRMVIDLFGMEIDEVRDRFPEIYQHVRLEVKEKKDGQGRLVGRDANNRESYRTYWWLFGEPRREMRPALANLDRFIATVDTATHRIFQFLPSETICDDKIVIVASDDPAVLGIVQSHIHATWALGQGTRLGQGDDPVYAKARCFDPFPFPHLSDDNKLAISAIAEELDAHRKRVQAQHPNLTLTGLYNVLERLRAGATPDDLDDGERRIFDDGLVLILKELHDRLDTAVTEAYGWPANLPDQEILARLVALNEERAAEERRGLVRWLRPDYQIPRFGSDVEKTKQIEADLVGGAGATATEPGKAKPSFPTDEMEQTAAVMAALLRGKAAASASAIAAGFRQGRRVEPKVTAVLAALTRMGVATSGDGGRTFSTRETA